ncbi:unnamed protein product [Orchesella dallaii]|uniref:Parathyroid hormone/parathyroid hormone-related peptide receptor n=1 Tax=Orchesella dallaii TaxID=48710 RepID=A0ABP1QRI8_9HEXA
MLFIGMSFYVGRDPVIEVTWLFCDQLFASSQGCFVAVLYCLLNGEVRCELGKKWTTWKSETETKNIWVPLNHITTRMQRRSTHDDLLTNGLSVTGAVSDPTNMGKGGKYRLDAKIITEPTHPDQEVTEEHNLTNETHEYCMEELMASTPPPTKKHVDHKNKI